MAKILNGLKIFFADWIWGTFFVKWIYQAFFLNLVCKKFDKWKGWIYLLPALVLLAVFTIWPIINTVRIAFLEGYGTMKELGGKTFNVGFANFANVIGEWGEETEFIIALRNTLILTVVTVPLSTFLALLIAVCLNAIKPLKRFLQTVFFLPYVTNSIAIGMVFAAMFNIIGTGVGTASEVVDSHGIVNNFIMFFGGDYVNWMNTGSTQFDNYVVMIIYIVWNALPFKILILLGGLQSVNKQYYEAAKIDSTSKWRVFWRITVPMLSPMLAYVIITGFIGGFKEYSSIVGIFGDDMGVGGYANLQTMVGLVYEALERGNAEGEASAAALLLFVIIFIVTMINLFVSKKKTHY